MALLALTESLASSQLPLPLPFTLVLLTLLLASAALHLLDPLRHLPGPLVCRLTPLWTYYHSYTGDECRRIQRLHASHGPVVRIGPNEVSISDGAALAPIYGDRGGFLKAACYSNFDVEGAATIFSGVDVAHRAVRSRAVMPMFSTARLRAGREVVDGSVAEFLDRLRREREEGVGGGAVDVLNLARGLALDSVCAYLFGRSFGGLAERRQGGRLSASAFVDGFVGLNRFFFLPPWAFAMVLGVVGAVWSDAEEQRESSRKVDEFVRTLVQQSDKGDDTYQGRLLAAGISAHEAKVQCKDVMFAGTDSTGMNLSTICWHLAKQPEIYTRLCEEIRRADSSPDGGPDNPQSLPYLDAVVREGLRISMANPTRLPRIVPPSGFNFTATTGEQYHFPPGTQVGVQIYTLHFNPDVFPDPFAFRPERWLDPTPEMQRDWLPFGMGARQCIARNLASQELLLAVREIAREGILTGAEAVGEKIEIVEWFNSRVKGERVEIVWK